MGLGTREVKSGPRRSQKVSERAGKDDRLLMIGRWWGARHSSDGG